VTIDISIVSDAPPEKLKEIERLSLDGCPGINTPSGAGRDPAERAAGELGGRVGGAVSPGEPPQR
jgi:hypothetical protein